MRRAYPALAVLTAGCASAGSSVNSGVAPKEFKKPPFYAGANVPNVAGVAYLPIRYQAERTDPRGDAGSPAAALVTEMNAYLDSIATPARLLPNVTEAGTPPGHQERGHRAAADPSPRRPAGSAARVAGRAQNPRVAADRASRPELTRLVPRRLRRLSLVVP